MNLYCLSGSEEKNLNNLPDLKYNIADKVNMYWTLKKQKTKLNIYHLPLVQVVQYGCLSVFAYEF